MLTSSHPAALYGHFRHAAERSPDKLALVVGNARYTYRDLLQEVDALADGLSIAGVHAGDPIGVLLPNCAEFVLTLLAGARLGVVIVPQSMGLGAEALAATFKAADVRHLIAWAGAISSLAGLSLPSAGIHVVVGGAREGWIPMPALIDTGRTTPGTASVLSEALPYLMVLTSGSTGQPKPILLSQRTKRLRAAAAAELYGVTADDVTLAATPLYHSLAQRLVLMPLISGGTSIVMAHFTPASWIATVRQHGVTFSIAVSSQLRLILDALIASRETLPSLRCLVSSSALLDNETKARLLAHLSCAFHECYGASEIAIATNLAPSAASRKLGSVGTAIPGTDVLILGENGQAVPPDTPGEIACRTPMLFSGYYAQPAATQAAMWGDYFRTGDLGRMDSEGFLFFLGRIKDIIISGGINIYPKDIEDVVATHPAVRECAAIPLPDEKLGEVVGVVVACHAPDAPAHPRDLQRLCMQHLGDFQQPRRFFVVDALPRNAMGKLDKPALRQAYSTGLHKG
ncbi:class I adenylate-forming enzyme family protein [Thiobacillus sp.]|jgi:acyl-CoA synthetase (AMP-forming)/AMP-acid ligase II|uniref:class I adenylate-forming enzyme family protein n=1 Tax=Thiobacillus sp. TaxID=924 RepID=UPI0025FF5C75|nr:class I adenylate-forming enzyme family protein [Thiobacillus sp.]